MSAEELGSKLAGTRVAPDEVAKFPGLGVRRLKLSARTRIGGLHVNILNDLDAFVFKRMEPSQVRDTSHLFTHILALDPSKFKALT